MACSCGFSHGFYFYPRPLRGGRLGLRKTARPVRDFYPRPLRGGRRIRTAFHLDLEKFLSTPSARRATGIIQQEFSIMQFLSTPSARRATWLHRIYTSPVGISIHALCEEGDVGVFFGTIGRAAISIHALCEEGDLFSIVLHLVSDKFLSTPSARRATVRPPRCGKRIRISIHALCEEGDAPNNLFRFQQYLFLSTPSARRAT